MNPLAIILIIGCGLFYAWFRWLVEHQTARLGAYWAKRKAARKAAAYAAQFTVYTFPSAPWYKAPGQQ